jgi:hypothetical protein
MPTLYWYGFLDSQNNYLEEKTKGYFILGCIDASDYFAIPIADMKIFAQEMRTSSKGDKSWSHVQIKVDESGYKLYLSPSNKEISLAKFQMAHD